MMTVDLTYAPIAILTFLAACMGTITGFAVSIFAMLTGKKRLARWTLGVLGGGLALYTVLLVMASLASQERVLARGLEKHYCEVDCHIAYSVTDVEQTPEMDGRKAQGVFYLIHLRTRFDESTFGQNRGDGPLTPNPRELFVLDDYGCRFSLFAIQADSTPLLSPLRPGESHQTVLVFDLPKDVQ